MRVLLQYKTFWQRFWAINIDALILWPIIFLDKWMFNFELPPFIEFLYTALSVLSVYIYSVVMHGKYGQTVGKMITGVKVLAIDEEPIGYKRALMRDSIVIFLVVLSLGIYGYSMAFDTQENTLIFFYQRLHVLQLCWFLIELITMLTNEKRRALHDFIAETVVRRI